MKTHHDHQRRRSSDRPDQSSTGFQRGSDRIENLHDVFSNQYRCAILYYLQESENPAELDEVASQALSWCRDGVEDSPAVSEPDRTGFLQTHVRAMDEFGLIVHDDERDTVRLREDVSITIAPRWNDA